MVSFVLYYALQYVLILTGMHIAIFVVAWLVITRLRAMIIINKSLTSNVNCIVLNSLKYSSLAYYACYTLATHIRMYLLRWFMHVQIMCVLRHLHACTLFNACVYNIWYMRAFSHT